jgi:hypothetical protein
MASRVDPNTTFMAASPSFRGIENRRRARRDEVAKRRQHLELDIRSARDMDQRRAVDPDHDLVS